jgi:hypothetical protein
MEQAALATLEMLTTLIPAPVGPLAGKAIQIARRALESQDDPEAYLQTILDGVEAQAQALAKAKWG